MAVRLLLLGASALLVLALAGGCGEDDVVVAALGEGCLINSDCADDLACVFRRCHHACNSTKDCPVSDGKQLRCVLGERPEHVCQLPDEVACGYNSECPPGQVCGIDGTCRDQCAGDRDCIEPQTCETGTCAEAEELDGGHLPIAEGNDAQVTGQPCSYTSECPAGLACVDGLCNYECFEDIDCLDDELFDCQANLCVFLAACVPGEQVSCACPDGSAAVQQCSADGSGYEPCPC